MAIEPNDNTLTLRCPAKLNLTLAVGPPRSDGLHPIASVMSVIDFADELELARLDRGPSVFHRRFADDAPRPEPIDWPIERDLVFRAHRLLEEFVERDLPIRCDLVKRIPSGAGLGGGSSDAASVLVGVRDLFALPIDAETLTRLASSLGADVAFAVHALLGQTAAVVTGTGETIAPIDTLARFEAVLVLPEGSCSTPAVYAAYDSLKSAQAVDPTLAKRWAGSSELLDARNDLTEAALSVCPAIAPAMRAIANLGLEPRLSGSGSAVFAIVDTQAQAVAIATELRQAGQNARAIRDARLGSQR